MPDTDISSITGDDSEDDTQEAIKQQRKEQEDEDSETEEEFHPHRGKILGISQFINISSMSWDKSYDGSTATANVELHYDSDDRDQFIRYVYKGAACKVKLRRSSDDGFTATGIEKTGLSEEEIKQREHIPTKEQLEEITKQENLDDLVNPSDKAVEEKIQEEMLAANPYTRQDGDAGIYGFITSVEHDDKGTELEIKDWGYCLEDNTKKLTFNNMLRSQVLEEVIKTYGLVPVVDFSGLKDDTITWTNLSSNGDDTGAYTAYSGADGSMTEDDIARIMTSVKYAHMGSNHDPLKGYEIVTSTHSGDCYDCTAFLYYAYNFKVGIPARDIVGPGHGHSGTHHVIQIYKNGAWVFPSWYANAPSGLRVNDEMLSGNYKVSREPPDAQGNIPPYRNEWYGDRG